MKVKIIDLDHKGNGIARIDNKIVFIPKCIPGDIVDIDVVRSHKKYDEGRVNNLLEESEDRIDSLCPYYDRCGGCNISTLNYSKQLEYKKNKIVNIFRRYLNMDIDPSVIGSDTRYEYRNKVTYKCVNGTLGLVDIDNNFINIDSCVLVSERVNELYSLLSEEDLSNVNKVIIKECDNGLILSIDGDMRTDNFREACLSIYVNHKCVYKREDGYISIGDINYIVSMDSFFQVNGNNIFRLYDVVLEYGDFNKNDKVIDLYCGVGSIRLYISKYVDSVLGIEIIEDAIKDANNNAKLNNINNVEFICGDVSKLVDDNVDGNIVIVDPPRIGLDNHTIEVLNNIDIDKLIYVSCDPMTLVRDIKLLSNYRLDKITLVDMFPQTHHVECVVKLIRNN